MLFEIGEELPLEGLSVAVAHLEPQHLAPSIGVHAHGHHSAGGDLERLALPASEPMAASGPAHPLQRLVLLERKLRLAAAVRKETCRLQPLLLQPPRVHRIRLIRLIRLICRIGLIDRIAHHSVTHEAIRVRAAPRRLCHRWEPQRPPGPHADRLLPHL